MSKIKYDSNLINLMTLFESMTGSKVKDCIVNDKIIFVVEENEIGKAIGKNGANIKRVEKALKKKVKVIEFSNDAAQFMRNLIYPIEVAEIKYGDNLVTINGRDTTTRAMLIGRERQNINHLTQIARRYFDVREIKVV